MKQHGKHYPIKPGFACGGAVKKRGMVDGGVAGRDYLVSLANSIPAAPPSGMAALSGVANSPVQMAAPAGQVRRIVQTALNATSDAVREVAIKDFDLAYQGAMEAAKLAVANRGQALEAARQFIVASITQAYTSGSQVAQVARDAEAKAKATAYAAFSARISAAEMALKATIADQGLKMEAAKANLAAELQMIEANVKTFANELQGLIAVAVAFANNARTGSSMQYSVNGT